MLAAADIAGWIAPAATMAAAMMTAANLGARVTGWGFVVFTVGSISWSIVGISSGQTNLLLTNAFLTLVNIVGVWRWLGRQARYDKGGARAMKRSLYGHSQTAFSMSGMTGARLLDRDGTVIGQVVDAMLGCEDHAITYLVVSCGGVGGVGETLHAVAPARLHFGAAALTYLGTGEELYALPRLKPDDWPGRKPKAA